VGRNGQTKARPNGRSSEAWAFVPANTTTASGQSGHCWSSHCFWPGCWRLLEVTACPAAGWRF